MSLRIDHRSDRPSHGNVAGLVTPSEKAQRSQLFVSFTAREFKLFKILSLTLIRLIVLNSLHFCIWWAGNDPFLIDGKYRVAMQLRAWQRLAWRLPFIQSSLLGWMKYRALISDYGKAHLEKRKSLPLDRSFTSRKSSLLAFVHNTVSLQGETWGMHADNAHLSLISTHQVYHAEFLPCLEKHGKTCHMLLSPEDTYLIQTAEDADGMRIIARYTNVSLLFQLSFQISNLSGPW